MAGREISVKKYVVKLSAEEREQLEAMICAGKHPAQSLTKARILLKADVSEGRLQSPSHGNRRSNSCRRRSARPRSTS